MPATQNAKRKKPRKAQLSLAEKKLVEHSKKAVTRYNIMRHRNGGIDTLYAFIVSDSGKVYDGACFEANLAHATLCAERHAIANLVMNECYQSRIKAIVIADPVPKTQKHSTPPCGTCRHIIWAQGTPDTVVILMQYIQTNMSWAFPVVEKHSIKDFYPHPYEPDRNLWDRFEPQ